jgi:hypothetical protein
MLNLSLDELQEWTISAVERQHPYHQHMHHFQVVRYPMDGLSYDETGLMPGLWRDTIPVADINPVGTMLDWSDCSSFSDSLVIRFVPRQFWGKMVFHCHNIPHSDHGMMAVAWIAPPPPNLCTTPACVLGLVLVPLAAFLLLAFLALVGVNLWKGTFRLVSLPPVVPTINDVSDEDGVDLEGKGSSSSTSLSSSDYDDLSSSDSVVSLSQSSSDDDKQVI